MPNISHYDIFLKAKENTKKILCKFRYFLLVSLSFLHYSLMVHMTCVKVIRASLLITSSIQAGFLIKLATVLCLTNPSGYFFFILYLFMISISSLSHEYSILRRLWCRKIIPKPTKNTILSSSPSWVLGLCHFCSIIPFFFY